MADAVDPVPEVRCWVNGGWRSAARTLDLAQQLVLGGMEHARGLGFEPHPDFAAVRDHLGEDGGRRDIEFGLDGKPFYIQGPYDDPTVTATLDRTVGPDGYTFLRSLAI